MLAAASLLKAMGKEESSTSAAEARRSRVLSGLKPILSRGALLTGSCAADGAADCAAADICLDIAVVPCPVPAEAVVPLSTSEATWLITGSM
jgi:hypothetical protein